MLFRSKSKVKGHLQLYHAFVADSVDEEDERTHQNGPSQVENGSAQPPPTRATEEDWEIVGKVSCTKTGCDTNFIIRKKEIPQAVAKGQRSQPNICHTTQIFLANRPS